MTAKKKSNFTHLDGKGKAKMVDVGKKEVSLREAIARAKLITNLETIKLIEDRRIEKGDVFSVARIAGIMAAKKTSELIPLCHPLNINYVEINFLVAKGKPEIEIEAKVRAKERTGVEMEALTACAVTALTIYDMCKAVDKEMVIADLRLVKKSGGKSGNYIRN